MEKGRRKKRGGRTAGASSYIIKQTNLHQKLTKAYIIIIGMHNYAGGYILYIHKDINIINRHTLRETRS